MGNERKRRESLKPFEYEGGTQHCGVGAYNLLQKHRGGEVRAMGAHAYFIPPGASPDSPAKNRGVVVNESGKVIGPLWPKRTVAEVRKRGANITDYVKRRYGPGGQPR